jgi:hypothetical protein
VALRIQKRIRKSSDGSVTESWRLIVEVYTPGDYREDLYPKKEDYKKYGFDPDDSFERAREKLKVIQARNKITREMERRAKILKRRERENGEDAAFLPRHIYQKFLTWLKHRRMWDEIPDKTLSHLRCMRSVVTHLAIDPSKWPDRPEAVYRFFLTKKLSISYMEKVLPLLNEYGYFYCREFAKPYLPIPNPSPDVSRRIDDANVTERDGKQEASDPIFPYMLEKLVSLPEEQQLWMRYSVFFGLRPSEIDSLKPKNRDKVWKLTKDSRGIPILHFYQKKLIKISRERRWKRIPGILKEQKELLKLLEKNPTLRRPYAKVIQKYLGKGYGLYGGRKGFEKYMRDQGQSFINISRWLGHQDIRRTEWNYREAEAVEYDPVPRS